MSCPVSGYSTRERHQCPRNRILDSILDHIGGTPMVRINKVGVDATTAEIVAKCEFFNAGGSVKDRIGRRMLMDAEAQGRVKLGDTLIEATSGNTGIGLSLASAVKGYKCIITLPQKMSAEKVNTMKALGSEIIRTPTEAAYDSPDSHISVAKRLNGELPNSHILDQYRNPSNIQAHYDGTAYEIFEQTQGRLDAIVVGAGTGGTITGVGRRLKELIPGILVVGVDPHGSILACDTDPVASNVVEGIGYDFIPDTLDRSVVDKWVKTGDKEAFLMARRLIREEGLLCGGSCGSAMLGAVAVAKELGPGKRVAVILPDSIRNYMSKHLVDEWMAERGYLDPVDPAAPDATTAPTSPGKGSQRKEQESIAHQVSMNQTQISELKLAHPITTTIDCSIHEAIQMMRSSSIDQLPIVSATGELQGLVSLDGLMKAVVSGLHEQGLKAIKSCDYGELHIIGTAASHRVRNNTLKQLQDALDARPVVLIIEFAGGVKRLRHVVTRIDFLSWTFDRIVAKTKA